MRVLLVDDHSLFAQSLAIVLSDLSNPLMKWKQLLKRIIQILF